MIMMTLVRTPKDARIKLNSIKPKHGIKYEVYGLSSKEIEILHRDPNGASHIIDKNSPGIEGADLEYCKDLYSLWYQIYRHFPSTGATLQFKEQNKSIQLF